MRTKLLITLLACGLFAPATALADVGTDWSKNCAKCHGKTGKGDTKAGKKLKAADYTDPAVQAKMKDDEMFKAVKDGQGKPKPDGELPMPSFKEKLGDDQIKALVAHVRSFKK